MRSIYSVENEERKIEKRVIGSFAIAIIAVCLFTVCTLVYYDRIVGAGDSFIAGILDRIEEARMREQLTELELIKYYNERMAKEGDESVEELGDALKIVKDSRLGISDIEVTNDYMNRTLTLFFKGEKSSIIDDHPIVGCVNYIDNIKVYSDDKGLYIEFFTSRIVEPVIEDNGDNIHLVLKEPKELHEHIIVVDAGHGGKMPGAMMGVLREKSINLEIVKELKELLDRDESIVAYFTRLDDSHVELKDRVKLANELNADLFLSVHQNSVDIGASTTTGTQTLYSESQKGDNNSKDFAAIINKSVLEATGAVDRGLVKGDRIYIIRKAKMPVALCETGFISNIEEGSKLNSNSYQKKVARGLYDGIKEAFNEGF